MSATNPPTSSAFSIRAFLSDIRVLQVIGQIVFVIFAFIAFGLLVSSISEQLVANSLNPSFAFLENRAGFEISEKPDWYTTDSTYFEAFQVGMINTLRIVIIGLVLATVLGVFVGIFLLSTNWLVKTISRTYVEILRNTPLLVQLFAWYFIVMFSFPQPREALTVPAEGVLFLSLRLVLYLIVFVFLARYVQRWLSDDPRRLGLLTATGAFVFMTEAAFWLYHNNAAWAGAYASGNISDPGFLLYVGLSAVLIGVAWFVPPPWRAYAIGATIGQALAGLLFYFGIMFDAALRIELYPIIYISIRGFVFPEILPTARFAQWFAFVVLGVVIAVALWVFLGRITEATGRAYPRPLYATLAVLGFAIGGWLLVGIAPTPTTIPVASDDGALTTIPIDQARDEGLMTPELEALYSTQPVLIAVPAQNRFGRFTAGTELSPEYMALLLGLVIYTSAFIAEIVRAGIQAVPPGQIEAARAVGLSTSQTLRLVILPQALRVIIPPMGNQYLNLAKNSSLALAIGYFDTFQVTTTIMNQSGQSIPAFIMVMAFYLTMSLVISAVMNWVNSRFQLVTR